MKSAPVLLLGLSLGLRVPAADPAGLDHWAFQPPARPPQPKVQNQKWARTPPDAFILARLEKEKLAPSPEADRATLIRRLSFDLLGLPPAPQEVAEFLADNSPDAYDQLVERLLGSPHYGERWGRHWLDVAGYADSNGYFSADSDRPLAWHYRDYVVRSFNADLPFDRFVQEQIAGDELCGYTRAGDITPDMEDRLAATHFLRNAPDGTGESDGNAAELRADRYAVLEGNVQIIGSALLGLTVQCARCHDHKFEPITQEEYYGLQAILKPIYNHDQWLKPNERNLTLGTRVQREENRRKLEKFEREWKAMKDALEGLTAPYRKLAQQEALEKIPEPLRGTLKSALDTKEKERTESMKALLKTNDAIAQIKDEDLARRFPEFESASAALKEAIKKKDGERPVPLPQLAVATDVTPGPPPHYLLVRGNYGNPGREVGPGVPAILCRGRLTPASSPSPANESGTNLAHKPTGNAAADALRAASSSGRRLAFARWAASTNNPVFARLTVNRIWQGHFGAGLVATTDNFGRTGAKPTHPELLDWLATELARAGYSVKSIHRLIVKSATYRQASRLRQDAFERDPDNRLWWRYPLRRLDAESLRDAMLSVSGELQLEMGGAYVPIDKSEEGQYVVNEKKRGATRRSLYLQQHRTNPVTFLDLFDGVKFNPNCAQRTTSTMSLQSLALLNSEFARARSRAFARRLMAEADVPSRLDRAFALVLSRPPTVAERQAAAEFLQAQQGQYAGQPEADARVWSDFCQMLLAANSFLYLE